MAVAKPVVEIDETRAALAIEWARILERIQPDLERVEAIRAELAALAANKYSIPGVELKVSVTRSSTFKPDLFTAAHPITKSPQFYKAVPDLDRLKAALAPDELAKFYAAGNSSVKLV